MSHEINLWLMKECVRHPRISGGFNLLLREFNEWLYKYRGERVAPDEFKEMLADEGLAVIEVLGVHLVPGLGLAEDWQAVIAGIPPGEGQL